MPSSLPSSLTSVLMSRLGSKSSCTSACLRMSLALSTIFLRSSLDAVAPLRTLIRSLTFTDSAIGAPSVRVCEFYHRRLKDALLRYVCPQKTRLTCRLNPVTAIHQPDIAAGKRLSADRAAAFEADP